MIWFKITRLSQIQSVRPVAATRHDPTCAQTRQTRDSLESAGLARPRAKKFEKKNRARSDLF
jgi:hypothetical protein